MTLQQAKERYEEIQIRTEEARENLHNGKISRTAFENEIDFLTAEESKAFDQILKLKK